MRKNCVGGNIAANKRGQAEAIIVLDFQKTHAFSGLEKVVIQNLPLLKMPIKSGSGNKGVR